MRAAACVLFLCLACEAAFRLYWFDLPESVLPWRCSPDEAMDLDLFDSDAEPAIGLRFRAGLHTYLQCKRFSTNEHAFRGGPIAVDKPERTVRIAVLGRSPDLGYAVHDEETWPAQLADLLNREGGPRFEVLNFGFIRQQLTRVVRLYERDARPLAPDLIIFDAGPQDLAPVQKEKYMHRSRDGALKQFSDQFFTYQWLRKSFEMFRAKSLRGLERGRSLGRFKKSIDSTTSTSSVLGDFVARRKEEGVPVFFVYVPSVTQVQRELDEAKIRAWCEQHEGCHYLAIERVSGDLEPAFPGETHGSARANGLIAREIQKKLEAFIPRS